MWLLCTENPLVLDSLSIYLNTLSVIGVYKIADEKVNTIDTYVLGHLLSRMKMGVWIIY